MKNANKQNVKCLEQKKIIINNKNMKKTNQTKN